MNWYVKTDGHDTNNGRSWADAKRTIQAAINAARAGDVIEVAAGTYRETLTLKNGIKLLGRGAGTTRIEYNGDDVVVDAYQVRSGEISGFTIAYAGSAGMPTILLQDSSLAITQNIVTGATFSGIQISGNSDPQIANNEINDNAQNGITVVHTGGRGTISGNVVSGNGSHGIEVRENSDPQVADNEIRNNAGHGTSHLHLDAHC